MAQDKSLSASLPGGAAGCMKRAWHTSTMQKLIAAIRKGVLQRVDAALGCMSVMAAQVAKQNAGRRHLGHCAKGYKSVSAFICA